MLYSNLGTGPLGHALALRLGTDYEGAVRARILDPLALKSTFIRLSTELSARLAPTEGSESFFLRAADAQVAFVVEADGWVEALVLRRAGQDQAALRVE